MTQFSTELASVFTVNLAVCGESVTYTPATGSAFTLTAVPHAVTRKTEIDVNGETVKGQMKFSALKSAFSGKTITPNEDTITQDGTAYLVRDYTEVGGAIIQFDAVREDVSRIGRGRRA